MELWGLQKNEALGTPRSMENRSAWNTEIYGKPKRVEHRGLWKTEARGTQRSTENRSTWNTEVYGKLKQVEHLGLWKTEAHKSLTFMENWSVENAEAFGTPKCVECRTVRKTEVYGKFSMCGILNCIEHQDVYGILKCLENWSVSEHWNEWKIQALCIMLKCTNKLNLLETEVYGILKCMEYRSIRSWTEDWSIHKTKVYGGLKWAENSSAKDTEVLGVWNAKATALWCIWKTEGPVFDLGMSSTCVVHTSVISYSADIVLRTSFPAGDKNQHGSQLVNEKWVLLVGNL